MATRTTPVRRNTLPGRWTPAEDETLRAMRESGEPFEQISRAVGRTPSACVYRAFMLGVYKRRRVSSPLANPAAEPPGRMTAHEHFLESCRAPQSESRSRARKRPCLCCRRSFHSQGPHHRLCTRCRGGSLHRYESPASVLR
jgi:hypothetical protein